MPDPYGLTHVVAALPVTRRAWGQVWGRPGVAFGGSPVSLRGQAAGVVGSGVTGTACFHRLIASRRRPLIVWAFEAVPANAGQRHQALLIAVVIAGCRTVPGAHSRAPRV